MAAPRYHGRRAGRNTSRRVPPAANPPPTQPIGTEYDEFEAEYSASASASNEWDLNRLLMQRLEERVEAMFRDRVNRLEWKVQSNASEISELRSVTRELSNNSHKLEIRHERDQQRIAQLETSLRRLEEDSNGGFFRGGGLLGMTEGNAVYYVIAGVIYLLVALMSAKSDKPAEPPSPLPGGTLILPAQE